MEGFCPPPHGGELGMRSENGKDDRVVLYTHIRRAWRRMELWICMKSDKDAVVDSGIRIEIRISEQHGIAK